MFNWMQYHSGNSHFSNLRIIGSKTVVNEILSLVLALLKKKSMFIFMCMRPLSKISLYAMFVPGVCSSLTKSEPLELELYRWLRATKWVLGSKHRSSVKAVKCS